MTIERALSPSKEEEGFSGELWTIKDLAEEGHIRGKRVLVRASTDLSLENLVDNLSTNSEHGLRLQSLKPTVDALLDEYGAKQVIVIGHNDRPEPNDGSWPSRPPNYDPERSLARMVRPLETILGRKVVFREDFNGDVEGEVVLFENLRFWPGESANDPEFAKRLASMADAYINNDFPTSHRDHASVTGITRFLPSAAGLHLAEEVRTISEMLRDPQRPFVAVMAGAKLDTKVDLIQKMATVADIVVVGGLLPTQMNRDDYPETVKIANLTEDETDISVESAREFARQIEEAGTIFWNGPLGFVEGGSDTGTEIVMEAIVASAGTTILAGGDTIAYAAKRGTLKHFTHVSTGGGAGLAAASGEELPGVLVLRKA